MRSLIVAMDDNYGIGNNGELPWYHSEDLKHFKEYTTGKTIIVGSTTYRTLPSLRDRNVIVCSNKKGCSAKWIVDNVKDFVVIGGSKTYETFLPYCEEAIITKVKGEHVCDSFFPVPAIPYKEKAIISQHDEFEIYKLSLFNAYTPDGGAVEYKPNATREDVEDWKKRQGVLARGQKITNLILHKDGRICFYKNPYTKNALDIQDYSK